MARQIGHSDRTRMAHGYAADGAAGASGAGLGSGAEGRLGSGRRAGRSGEGAEKPRPQVAGDEPALGVGGGVKAYVHLVGAGLRAALADLGQVEGGCRAGAEADPERRAPPLFVAPHQHIAGSRQRRAFDQGVDVVRIEAAGSAAPHVLVRRQNRWHACGAGSGAAWRGTVLMLTIRAAMDGRD